MKVGGIGKTGSSVADQDVVIRVFTPPELAVLLGVTDKTIRDWATRRSLPHYTTPSGRMKFKADEVRRYLESKGMPIPKELVL